MKYAPVMPRGSEDLLPPTACVMMFADIAYANREYLEFYARRDGCIMDNQIYERQRPLEPAGMKNIASAIHPSLVIVPDVRGNAAATIANAKRYLPLLQDFTVAGVVQGQSRGENEDCMDFWAAQGVPYVAVPMRVDGRAMSRLELYNEVVRPRLPSATKVHLLGVEAWPYHDEMRLARYPEIVSLDTAEPVSATIWGCDILASNVWTGRPPGYMDNPKTYRLNLSIRRPLLWRNIQRFSDLIATRPASEAPVTRVKG